MFEVVQDGPSGLNARIQEQTGLTITVVFFKYGFAVVVKFNYQTVCRFDCGNFDMVGFHIASFQVTNI